MRYGKNQLLSLRNWLGGAWVYNNKKKLLPRWKQWTLRKKSAQWGTQRLIFHGEAPSNWNFPEDFDNWVLKLVSCKSNDTYANLYSNYFPQGVSLQSVWLHPFSIQSHQGRLVGLVRLEVSESEKLNERMLCSKKSLLSDSFQKHVYFESGRVTINVAMTFRGHLCF